MRDPRIARVAEILVDYSTEVKEDEVVEIYAFEGAKPLFLACEIGRRGHPAIVAGEHPVSPKESEAGLSGKGTV